jgi:hypothetical protein
VCISDVRTNPHEKHMPPYTEDLLIFTVATSNGCTSQRSLPVLRVCINLNRIPRGRDRAYFLSNVSDLLTQLATPSIATVKTCLLTPLEISHGEPLSGIDPSVLDARSVLFDRR